MRLPLLMPVAWLLLLHTAALYLFTTGFFLTRFEVPDVSDCRVHPASASLHQPHHSRQNLRHSDNSNDDAPGECWLPSRFRRVVFVVIDALRFDFVRSERGAASPSFFLNRLPVLTETLATRPSHSLLFKFVADPPTMTMQRLKGLTTGSLPTFLDIKDNMASSSAIAEDNLLRQLRAQGRGVVFMGDDTWDALYGDTFFKRKYAFDSFNVKDLDTVDRGVERHLFPELARQDWDLLIAHFLGVDHVGHTHGPSSVFMAQKLDEMNRVLRRLLDALPDNDTLLAVLGDHGMSPDGNHGGATDDETGAALFLYAKQPIVADELRPYAQRWGQEIPQVDLVPTLALLSGLPIPFGNLGSVIPSLFFSPQPGGQGSTLADGNVNKGGAGREHRLAAALESLEAALRLNVDQVRRYLWTYSSASKLPAQAYDALERMLLGISVVKDELAFLEMDPAVVSPSTLTRKVELLENLVSRQQQYLREALALGRSIWTQFDLCSMAWGFLLLTWSLLLLALDCLNPSVAMLCDQRAFTVNSAAKTAMVAMVAGGVSAVTALFLPSSHPLTRWLPASPLSRALAVLTTLALASASVRTWHLRRELKGVRNFVGTTDSVRVVAFGVALMHSLALLSNSYIVAEDKVMTFLSETIGFFLLFHAQRTGPAVETGLRKSRTVAAVVFIAISRLASALEPPNIIQSTPTLLRTYIPLVTLVALASLFSSFFKSFGCLDGRFPSLTVAVAVNCVACALYWATAPSSWAVLRLWLPRAVYLSFLAPLGVFWWRSTRGEDATGWLLLGLFWQFVPCYMLVLGPSSPVSVLSASLQLLSLAFVARTATSCSKSKPVDTSEARPAWVLLLPSAASHAFFFTGHQNTFTSLQNAAGFVGLDAFQFHASGALLALNTFGNYALGLLALPWLLVGGATEPIGSSTAWRAALLAFLASLALPAAVSTAFVALQRRHLMVWAIFAPKFLFDGVALLVVDALALLLLAPAAMAVATRSATTSGV